MRAPSSQRNLTALALASGEWPRLVLLISPGKLGPDSVRVGHGELGEDLEGVLEVPLHAVGVTGRVADPGEGLVRPRLLGAVANLARQRERSLVEGPGLADVV